MLLCDRKTGETLSDYLLNIIIEKENKRERIEPSCH